MKRAIERLSIALAATLILSTAPAIAQSQPGMQHQAAEPAGHQAFDRPTLEIMSPSRWH